MLRDLLAVFLLALFLGLMAARAMAGDSPTLDLNRATPRELMELPGVGAKRADDIVRYRTTHPFRRTADLMRIRGISSKLFVRIRPLVHVDPAEPVKPLEQKTTGGS